MTLRIVEQVTLCKRCGVYHTAGTCPRCGVSVRVVGRKAYRPASRMNKTEERYSMRLEAQKGLGEITWYRFEAVKFRLADATFYTPDFMVVLPGGRIEFHEVKGARIWDDAAVKFKVAAEMFPVFGWRLLQWKGGTWTELRSSDNGGAVER